MKIDHFWSACIWSFQSHFLYKFSGRIAAICFIDFVIIVYCYKISRYFRYAKLNWPSNNNENFRIFIAELRLKNGETHIQIDNDFKKKSILSTISKLSPYDIGHIKPMSYGLWFVTHFILIFKWKKMVMVVIG